ncbi:hypothetical protein BCV70DRAFT_198737 [Testicularia cyperi]|uniref:Uncharacterized protein n=1 Tax=Testicularia cyperi TaxID=1882483 RepID=A0A317XTR4_9BASI|nr:hypothetical protein BCV70DRAFT_198737 [Testicularia cyperi]
MAKAACTFFDKTAPRSSLLSSWPGRGCLVAVLPRPFLEHVTGTGRLAPSASRHRAVSTSSLRQIRLGPTEAFGRAVSASSRRAVLGSTRHNEPNGRQHPSSSLRDTKAFIALMLSTAAVKFPRAAYSTSTIIFIVHQQYVRALATELSVPESDLHPDMQRTRGTTAHAPLSLAQLATQLEPHYCTVLATVLSMRPRLCTLILGTLQYSSS